MVRVSRRSFKSIKDFDINISIFKTGLFLLVLALGNSLTSGVRSGISEYSLKVDKLVSEKIGKQIKDSYGWRSKQESGATIRRWKYR